MTAECARALAAAECVVKRAAAAGRAARGLHGAQSGSSAPAGGAAGRAGRGIRLLCALWRTAATQGFYSGACGLLPLLAEKRRCGAGAAGHFQRAALAARWAAPQDWTLVSAHGAACDAAAAGAAADRCFSSRAARSARRCAQLCEAGLGGLAP